METLCPEAEKLLVAFHKALGRGEVRPKAIGRGEVRTPSPLLLSTRRPLGLWPPCSQKQPSLRAQRCPHLPRHPTAPEPRAVSQTTHGHRLSGKSSDPLCWVSSTGGKPLLQWPSARRDLGRPSWLDLVSPPMSVPFLLSRPTHSDAM